MLFRSVIISLIVSGCLSSTDYDQFLSKTSNELKELVGESDAVSSETEEAIADEDETCSSVVCHPCWFPSWLITDEIIRCNRRQACKFLNVKCNIILSTKISSLSRESMLASKINKFAELYVTRATPIHKSSEPRRVKEGLIITINQMFEKHIQSLFDEDDPSMIKFVAPCWFPAQRMTKEQLECRSNRSCLHSECKPPSDNKFIILADAYVGFRTLISTWLDVESDTLATQLALVDRLFDSMAESNAKTDQDYQPPIKEHALTCYPDWVPDWLITPSERVYRYSQYCKDAWAAYHAQQQRDAAALKAYQAWREKRLNNRNLQASVEASSDVGQLLSTVGTAYKEVQSVLVSHTAPDVHSRMQPQIDHLFEDLLVRLQEYRDGQVIKAVGNSISADLSEALNEKRN